MKDQVQKYLSLIKFSHTIFALPFAMLGLTLAYVRYHPENIARSLLLVVLAMVFARSAAMSFNRYLDRDIDAKNTRTAVREIPSGKISAQNALIFTRVNALLFVLCCYFINPLCFYLSFVALFIVLGYSYTKRFTALCHFVLGLGLSLAPIGAYLAVYPAWDSLPILLSFIVLTWVSGFDIIYALQDAEFDQQQGLYSVPAAVGKPNALMFSSFVHIICASLLVIFTYLLLDQYSMTGNLSWLATILFVGLLVYQHILVKSDDLSYVNLAFFTLNGIGSIVFCGLVIADLLS